ncbi:EF-hand domain-containing protein [Zoogloea sp.]|uniref:EF-hand domain-containing protein n=1 Tax=Zoogloea sp. TaxID=49181 RepID=UPI0035AE62D3
MVSSISSSGTSAVAMSRPDPAQMVSRLFARLDARGQGFIEQSDLQSAFSQAFGNATSGTDASSDSSALFAALDGDSNGKVTESEFSSGLQKLAEALDNQAFGSRVGGHGGGVGRPGEADGDDAGLTQDQLKRQLQEMGSTDSARASLLSRIVSNFDKADSDGDGKVTRAEAMAYDQSTRAASATGSGSASVTEVSAGASSESSRAEARLLHRLMALMHSYGSDSTTATTGQGLSVSA